MKKIYEYNNLNVQWYKLWEKRGICYPEYNNKKKYCITIPPPNITGKLHMGHAFQCTLMDILIRYYKMNNFSTLWKMGTDHAGIATQILIEQKLKNNKNKNFKIFSQKWKKISIKRINKQLKTQGCLLNWKTSRFTLDKHFSYAVKRAFINLYNKQIIYKSERLVNWDPILETAISDLETIYKEESTKLYEIKYRINDEHNNYINIATTRPETIFADEAIAINPKDKRYDDIKNKHAIIPIINKKIPIILDKNVDINFGTGCLKITPAHDFTDFEIGKKHNLPMLNILQKNGKLNNNVPKNYQNLKIKEARTQIEKELKLKNLIKNIHQYKNKIPIGDRSGNVIEPFLTKQWYVKTMPLITPVKKAIKENKIKIIPQKWEKNFFNWINNIKDWCISRQIWWGHKIPIWYDENNNEYVGENEKTIRKIKKLNKTITLKQETDVLDTWFSSALWPFASLGWPNKTIEYKTFYPTNTLITGFDIIFFWAIRMLMFGINFTKKIPFNEIYIHGLIRDNYGNKMSKTKGNVIDPSDIINGISKKDLIIKQTSNLLNDKIKNKIIENINKEFPNGINAYGVDPLRLTFSSLATENISIKLNLEKIDKYKHFCNKIWNAGKFIKININHNHCHNHYDITSLWILSIWQKTKKQIITYINNRKFSHATEKIYKFTWDEFCSWYIEIIKIIIKNANKKTNTINCTLKIFNEILKTLHPFAPYITEELYLILNKNDKSIIETNYPIKKNTLINKYAEKCILFLKIITTKLRHIKIKKNTTQTMSLEITKQKDLILIEKIKNILKHKNKINKIYIQLKNTNMFHIKISKNINCYINNKIENKPTNKNIKKNIELLEKTLKNKNFLNNANKNIIKEKENKLKELKILINN